MCVAFHEIFHLIVEFELAPSTAIISPTTFDGVFICFSFNVYILARTLSQSQPTHTCTRTECIRSQTWKQYAFVSSFGCSTIAYIQACSYSHTYEHFVPNEKFLLRALRFVPAPSCSNATLLSYPSLIVTHAATYTRICNRHNIHFASYAWRLLTVPMIYGCVEYVIRGQSRRDHFIAIRINQSESMMIFWLFLWN